MFMLFQFYNNTQVLYMILDYLVKQVYAVQKIITQYDLLLKGTKHSIKNIYIYIYKYIYI